MQRHQFENNFFFKFSFLTFANHDALQYPNSQLSLVCCSDIPGLLAEFNNEYTLAIVPSWFASVAHQAPVCFRWGYFGSSTSRQTTNHAWPEKTRMAV